MKRKFSEGDVITCKECNTELIVGVNWSQSRKTKGHFVCNNCINKKYKQRKLDDQSYNQSQKEYYRQYNSTDERKEINSKRQKEWKEANVEWVKERDRRSSLLRKYGITLEDYYNLLKKQGNVCAICSTETPTGIGTFHVDHCHKTGKIRGILCSKCNHSLGLFNEDENIIYKAYEYIKNQGV